MDRSKACPECGIKKAFETKKAVITEEILTKENNRPVQVVTIPYQDEEGEWFAAEVNVDITERKKAENALRMAKDYAELVYRVIPSAIFTVDKERRITSWNNKAAEITGYTEKEVLAKECFMFMELPCREKCGLYDDNVSKPILAKECVIIRKDGEKRTVLKNADLLRDLNGNCIGGIESFEDITDR